MDGFELNKVAGAILLAGVIAMLTGFVSRILIPEPHGEESLIVASGVEPESAAGAEEEAPQPIGPLLAAADPDEGMNVARKCTACHTFEQGGAHKVGPNLWDVVGAEKAHAGDYSYSSALASAEGTWTFDDLNAFLQNPREAIPGTKMSFAGLKRPEERAAILAYMRTLSDEPEPLPAAEAPAAPEPATEAAAEGQAQQQEQQQQQQPAAAAPATEAAPGSMDGAPAPVGRGAPAEGAADQTSGPAAAPQGAGGQVTEQPGFGQPDTSGQGAAGAAGDRTAPSQPTPAQPPSTMEPAPATPAPPDPAAAAPQRDSSAVTPPAVTQKAEAVSPVALVSAASPEAGANVARKCTACHTFDRDGANRVGPNLWNVVGAPIAHRADYRYSKAMEQMDGEWTYEALFAYLETPREYVPGTKMTFAGLKKPEDRAAVVAYMRTMADNPPRLQ